MHHRHLALAALALALGVTSTSIADARPTVTLTPRTAKPGEPVLVTVTGADAPAKGKADGTVLAFFATRRGHQAVFAIPLDRPAGPLDVEIEGAAKAAVVEVRAHVFPEAEVVVEEEMANPPPAERERIDADNKAIRASFARADEPPRFTGRFRRPSGGKVTSPFGEWRTFNDGHRSQHLGVDYGARKGARVRSINAGTVVLVRDCFLAGKTVVVAHGGGVASAYFHLDGVTVAEGDAVEAGAKIAEVGSTGRTTGPHVHLSIWMPGGFADPVRFLRLPIRPVRPTRQDPGGRAGPSGR